MVYLSLGTNLGDKQKNLHGAIALINERIGTVVRQSSFIETEPWGFSSENTFLNACVAVDTQLTPRQLLCETQEIERLLGRTVKSADGEYHDRPIDIDILLYDDIEVSEPDLVIPHPLMHQRDFVMIPLREIMDSGHKVFHTDVVGGNCSANTDLIARKGSLLAAGTLSESR